MTPFIRTAGGDVAPEALGHVDYHEHLFQVSPILPGDELDDEDAALEETRQFAASGFETMVDATPLGLGRRPAAARRIAAATGVTVVLTTGLHRREHYRDGDPLLAAGSTSWPPRSRPISSRGRPSPAASAIRRCARAC